MKYGHLRVICYFQHGQEHVLCLHAMIHLVERDQVEVLHYSVLTVLVVLIYDRQTLIAITTGSIRRYCNAFDSLGIQFRVWRVGGHPTPRASSLLDLTATDYIACKVSYPFK